MLSHAHVDWELNVLLFLYPINSLYQKYQPINTLVSNINQIHSCYPFNTSLRHVIKCGRKFFGLISLAAATKTRSRKARRPHFVGQKKKNPLQSLEGKCTRIISSQPKRFETKKHHVSYKVNLEPTRGQQ